MEKQDAFIRSMAAAFVEKRENSYNVLYVYGSPADTGALAEQIYRAYRTRNPQGVILRKDGFSFNRELIEYVLTGKNLHELEMPACDLLIFENIEGVGGKMMSEEIVYLMVDGMLRQNGKILVTGSGPVHDLMTLQPRICAQLIGGINQAV